MTSPDRGVCVKCGKETPISPQRVAELRAKVPHFPPYLDGTLCMECLKADPDLRAKAEAWLHEEGLRWERELRGALVRPLEAIDRFVERWK